VARFPQNECKSLRHNVQHSTSTSSSPGPRCGNGNSSIRKGEPGPLKMAARELRVMVFLSTRWPTLICPNRSIASAICCNQSEGVESTQLAVRKSLELASCIEPLSHFDRFLRLFFAEFVSIAGPYAVATMDLKMGFAQ